MSSDIHDLINKTQNARMRIRLLAIAHFLEGKNRTEIAQFLKVSRTSVNKWVQSYLDSGIDGLNEKAHTGRPSALNPKQLEEIRQFVIQNALKKDGGRLQGYDIKEFISSKFGVHLQKSRVYQILHELDLSWITTRSMHPKNKEEAQESFKKIRK